MVQIETKQLKKHKIITRWSLIGKDYLPLVEALGNEISLRIQTRGLARLSYFIGQRW